MPSCSRPASWSWAQRSRAGRLVRCARESSSGWWCAPRCVAVPRVLLPFFVVCPALDAGRVSVAGASSFALLYTLQLFCVADGSACRVGGSLASCDCLALRAVWRVAGFPTLPCCTPPLCPGGCDASLSRNCFLFFLGRAYGGVAALTPPPRCLGVWRCGSCRIFGKACVMWCTALLRTGPMLRGCDAWHKSPAASSHDATLLACSPCTCCWCPSCTS
jgi:hypothetical protein